MGARVYLPTAGRFLQVDPIEGGTANAYVYPGDPVNGNDYSGLLGCSNLGFLKKACNKVFGNNKQAKKTTKPNALGGYIHWLAGAGKSMAMKADSVSWGPLSNDDRAALAQNAGKNRSVDIGIQASGFNGSSHIGRGTGTFRGNITKTSTGYVATGTLTPYRDTYDFNMDSSRVGLGNPATALGALSGMVANQATFGIIRPTSYYIEFEGSVEVNWSW